VLSLGWLTLDWSNDYAVVTNRRVVKLEKVLLIYDSRQEIPLDAILADDLKTDQFGRMLDYGSILVRTYTGVLELNHLPFPQLVINLINEMRGRKKFRHRHEQLDLIDQTLRERFEKRAAKKGLPDLDESQVHVKTGALQEFLSKMFLLRIQEGDTVTYRTHWFILLKKIGLPSLLLFLSVVLVFLIWFNLIPVSASIGTVLVVSLVPFLGLWWTYRYVDWRNDRYVVTPSSSWISTASRWAPRNANRPRSAISSASTMSARISSVWSSISARCTSRLAIPHSPSTTWSTGRGAAGSVPVLHGKQETWRKPAVSRNATSRWRIGSNATMITWGGSTG